MELRCDRCLAWLSTGEEPLPGRTYRIPCACGNTVQLEAGGAGVLAGDASAPASSPPADDPFLRALSAGLDRPVEVAARLEDVRLAERDPDADLDEPEDRVTGGVSFDDLLRRARARGFLAGAAAGAIGVAVVVAVLAVATSRAERTTTLVVTEPPAAAPPSPEPAPPVPDRRPERPIARKRAAAAAARAGGTPAPGGAPRAPPAEGAVAERPVPAAARADAAAERALPAAPRDRDPRAPATPPVEPPAPAAGAPPAAAPASAPSDPGAAGSERSAAPSSPAPAPAASTRPGRPFPEEDVARALRARRAAVADCVAATPGDAPAAHGQRFWLTLVIDPGGQVSEVQLDDPAVGDTPLGVCVLRVARTLTFAPFEGAPYRVELALDSGD